MEMRGCQLVGANLCSFLLLSMLLLPLVALPAAADRKSSRPKMKCPSQDFAAFSRAFAESVEVQRVFTMYPLTKMSLVNEGQEPFEREGSFKQSQLEFPLVPSAEDRAKRGLQMAVMGSTPTTANFKVWKEDSDVWLVTYYFEKRDCWYLTREEDHSL